MINFGKWMVLVFNGGLIQFLLWRFVIVVGLVYVIHGIKVDWDRELAKSPHKLGEVVAVKCLTDPGVITKIRLRDYPSDHSGYQYRIRSGTNSYWYDEWEFGVCQVIL